MTAWSEVVIGALGSGFGLLVLKELVPVAKEWLKPKPKPDSKPPAQVSVTVGAQPQPLPTDTGRWDIPVCAKHDGMVADLMRAIEREGAETRTEIARLAFKVEGHGEWKAAADVRIGTLEREMGRMQNGKRP